MKNTSRAAKNAVLDVLRFQLVQLCCELLENTQKTAFLITI